MKSETLSETPEGGPSSRMGHYRCRLVLGDCCVHLYCHPFVDQIAGYTESGLGQSFHYNRYGGGETLR